MVTVFFIFYVLFITGVYVSKSKFQALACNVLCCLSCAVYLYMVDGHAGVIACIAAASGSLYQIYASRNITGGGDDKKALLYKSIGSIAFTVIGIAAVYQTPSDLLLVLAIVSCRGSEMLDCNRQIKLGYLLAEAMWFVYAAYNDLFEMYAVHCVMICLGLFTMYALPKLRETYQSYQYRVAS